MAAAAAGAAIVTCVKLLVGGIVVLCTVLTAISVASHGKQ